LDRKEYTMPIRFFALLIAAAPLLSSCGERAPEGAMLLRASRIYMAPDKPPIDDGAILVKDGRILAIGAADTVATRGAKEYEACGGGIVTAGFQNSHVHFMGDPFLNAGNRPAAELGAAVDDMLTRFGFTGVLDAASDVDNTVALRARIESGDVAGPRILTAGSGIYPANGIPYYLRDLPAEVLAKLQQPATVEDALADVQSNLDRGADATKLFVMTPQDNGRAVFMSPDIAIAAADETHRRGLPVLAHPTGVKGINLAIEAGVDVLMHTTIEEGGSVWDAALVTQLTEQDIAVVPTLMLWPYELERANLPAEIVKRATGDAIAQLRAFATAGGQVLFGTDAGYVTTFDPTEEYRLMARALQPMQILASLTTAPAARWKESEQRGRVMEGFAADLVVLDADPGKEASNFAKVRCTLRAGRVIHGPAAADP
jgi:imidazolonepropionase-like amidohydrolase